MLIPTNLKVKLPKDLAYPLGSEAISEALTDAPQFEKLVISFTAYNFGFASDFQEARKRNQPYNIFRVSLIHPLKGLSSPNQFIEEGFYDENWGINVYAVPSQCKSIAKELLITAGLPKAKEWLETPRTEIWKTGRKHFQILFHEKEGKILIEQD